MNHLSTATARASAVGASAMAENSSGRSFQYASKDIRSYPDHVDHRRDHLNAKVACREERSDFVEEASFNIELQVGQSNLVST